MVTYHAVQSEKKEHLNNSKETMGTSWRCLGNKLDMFLCLARRVVEFSSTLKAWVVDATNEQEKQRNKKKHVASTNKTSWWFQPI